MRRDDRQALTYRLTEAAEFDLIHVYIEGVREFGVRQADIYHDLLEQAFQRIAHNPEITRERKEIKPPVRVLPCGSHMIIYETDADGVLILRIRHHKEDWVENPL